jgi:hypothetical protein
MINIISWSKDRAPQLDLMLQTYKKHFKEWKTQPFNIIFKYSSEEYRKGYELVQKYHPEFNYILETNFRDDTLRCFNQSKEYYVSFLVDDDIFINDISLEDEEFKEFDRNPLITCLSPRLAPYVDFCYTQNAPAQKPVLNEKNVFNWREKCTGDWCYPYSVAAFHIFRKTDILALNNIQFRAPNSFEGNALCSIPFHGRDYMICYNQAKTFTAANNKVQTENNNRHENTDRLDVLNSVFLSGKRLDENENSGLIATTCHGPISLKWK